ncbi:MAG: O-antigen ligase family protein [Rubrivivax sp.]
MSRTLALHAPIRPWQRQGAAARAALIVAALLLAPLLGLMTVFLPWQYVVVLVGAPILAVAAISFPLAGLVAVYALIFEAVPGFLQPDLPIGGIRLKLFDLAIAYLLAIALCRAVLQGRTLWAPLREFRWPLVYLLVALAASVFYVKTMAPNDRMLAEARAHIVWLLLPLTVFTLSTRDKHRRFLLCCAGIVAVVCVYMLLQTGLDLRIMTGSRVEALDAGANADVVRSIAGGAIYIVVFVMFLTLNRLWEGRLSGWVALPLLLLLLLGIAVQFGRGIWVASAMGLLVSAVVFRGFSGLLKTSLAMGTLLALAFSLVLVVKPKTAEAMLERVTSIQGEIERGGSFGWRRIENETARRVIAARPLMGTGVGGDYKGVVSRTASFANETTYIHNGYLYFPLKMGIWTAGIPFAFMLAFALCVRRYRRGDDGGGLDRGLLAALIGAFVVPLAASYTQPEWTNPKGIAAYSLLMAVLVQMANLARSERSSDDQGPA